MVTLCFRRSLPVFFLVSVIIGVAQAQDTDRLSAEFHRKRREALREMMPQNSVAVIFSNPVRNRSNSVDFQYSQNPGFYYLTGHIEPDAALFLFKDSLNAGTREILFVEGPNSGSATWSGDAADPSMIKKQLGIESVALNREIGQLAGKLCDKTVWISWPDQPRNAAYSETGITTLVDQIHTHLRFCAKETDTLILDKSLAVLREVKQPEELVLMKKAISLTINGFTDMIKAVKPGMKEYQAQAIVEYAGKMGGSEYQGYPSISGTGGNACVLHYTFNRSELKSGELLLADMGAEYHGYTADITRTVPVNGKFTEAQLLLYNLVLKAQDAGIEACKVGASFTASHLAAKQVLTEGLLELGIIKTASETDRYFMHGTSHYLGLDVHDAGTKGKLKAGTVMTVEPGIYIRSGSPCDKKWWNNGIRIEDDILVTENGPVNLSGTLPRKASEIEKLMNSGSE